MGLNVLSCQNDCKTFKQSEVSIAVVRILFLVTSETVLNVWYAMPWLCNFLQCPAKLSFFSERWYYCWHELLVVRLCSSIIYYGGTGARYVLAADATVFVAIVEVHGAEGGRSKWINSITHSSRYCSRIPTNSVGKSLIPFTANSASKYCSFAHLAATVRRRSWFLTWSIPFCINLLVYTSGNFLLQHLLLTGFNI